MNLKKIKAIYLGIPSIKLLYAIFRLYKNRSYDNNDKNYKINNTCIGYPPYVPINFN